MHIIRINSFLFRLLLGYLYSREANIPRFIKFYLTEEAFELKNQHSAKSKTQQWLVSCLGMPCICQLGISKFNSNFYLLCRASVPVAKKDIHKTREQVQSSCSIVKVKRMFGMT